MTPEERAAYEGRVDRLHKLAARDKALMAAGQAALDWAHDTGSCHFCDFHDPIHTLTNLVDGDGRELDAIPHDDECPLKGIET